MPIKPSSRLPRRFNRPVSKHTRLLVERRHKRRKKIRKEWWKRWMRKGQRLFSDWQRAFRTWLIVGLIGLVLLAIGLVLFSPIVHVREIRVVRTDPRLDVEHVQRVLASLFERHLLFLSGYEVKSMLRDGIPDLENVDVQKEYPSTLVVRITLDPIIARLLIDDPEEVSDSAVGTGTLAHDYLTDEGMYVAYTMVDDDDVPYLIRLVDWGVRPVPGTVLLSEEFLARLRAAEQALVTQFGHEVIARTAYMRAREFHVRTDRFTLWFDEASPLEEQLKRYRAFLRTIGPEEVIEYIDLRLSDRVMYR